MEDILYKVLEGTVNIQAYDSLTGQVIDIISDFEAIAKMLTYKEVSKKHRQVREMVKYYYEDKMMVFQKMFLKAYKELSGIEMRMLIYLMGIMDYENYIYKTQKEMAKDIGIAERNVQLALRGLREKGYIEVFRKGVENYYRINPEMVWKGSEKTHYQVLKERNPLLNR